MLYTELNTFRRLAPWVFFSCRVCVPISNSSSKRKKNTTRSATKCTKQNANAQQTHSHTHTAKKEDIRKQYQSHASSVKLFSFLDIYFLFVYILFGKYVKGGSEREREIPIIFFYLSLISFGSAYA